MASRLLAVTAENRVHVQATSLGTNKSVVLRWPLTIGSGDVKDILLSDMGRYKNAVPVSNDFPNAFTVVSAAIDDTITSVPIYKNGLRSWVVTPGVDDSQTDLITAAQFGRQSFAQGMRLWLKMELSFLANGMSIPFSDRAVSNVSGSQVLFFDNAATTIVNGVDTLGVFTTSGAAPGALTGGYCPVILGHYVSDIEPKVLYGNGDSILRGFGDTTSTPVGSGMFQRILYDNGSASRILSGINFARDGSFSTDYLTSPGDWVALYSKYCTVGIDEPSTNDFGASPGTGQTAATQFGRAQQTAIKMKGTYNLRKVMRLFLGNSTTSTSTNWTSDADQAVAGVGWGPGGNIEQFHNLLLTMLGVYVDAVVPMASFRSSGNRYLFPSNGTNDYATADGIHPTTVLYILLAAEVRAALDAINIYSESFFSSLRYSSNDQPKLLNFGSARFWSYVTSAPLSQITTAGYFSNAYALGMRANDYILVTGTVSPFSVSTYQITSVPVGGAAVLSAAL